MDQIHKVLFDGLLKGGLRTEDQFMKLKTSDIENITIQNDKNFSLSRLEFEIWIKKSQTVLDEATTAWGIKVERVEM